MPHGSPSRKYVVTLAVAAFLVLAGGWLARPRDVEQAPAPVATETELEQLARRAQRRSLENMSQFFVDVVRDVAPSIAYLPSIEASGVVWDSTHVVTATRPGGWPAGQVSLTARTGLQAEPQTWGPELPLSVLTVTPEGEALTAARRSGSLPVMGAWLIAVWRDDSGLAHDVGQFRRTTALHCGGTTGQSVVSSLALTRSMAGGGLFDLDGGLVAVILPCAQGLAAVAVASLETGVQHAMSSQRGLEARYGFTVDVMSDAERAYFRPSGGLLVRQVWLDYPADVSGLWPGDVILAADGRSATGTDLDMLAASEGPLELTVQRGRTRRTIEIAPAMAAQPGADLNRAGFALERQTSTGFRIHVVQPGSPADIAGIDAGDRLLRIDRAQPRGAAEIEHIIGDARPHSIWVELLRDRRRFGVLLR